jgi:hypothetical protein
MKKNNRILSTPMQNILLKDEIEKLQLQLITQEEKYRKAIKQDRTLQEIKPIRLQIKVLQEKITAFEATSIYIN